ncbi:MAG: hypothetical protein UU77_C0023G0009 [candidate division WWE3 bacterium GW2011_GWC1_41_7]|jgi:hypothetical protein|uniref:Uncharacterized protein n=4 Tax=Katanobacteria TaxID=422282 RepID=A0A0G0X6L2_UNCKA|nr:MAG: hypothetical protein UU72_C0005G0010 [candidate division WWE3 bacterium GW2011_GWB1_41_6]KKS20585.1 MAG: hypothetical protein UU77_C0023G0009 [candidate division WWE3 bacterium GW2011_GWC1_41_7]KKS22355.1 MAG: hypothetical protein UU80_C0008G0010 [candidate division WWE3 bacterium GW2011_GWA1_41_8]OGC58265.1 MAG: hypothetical protein A2976_04170 [candidate division WWE3 bacterium RIFCSPLOWO2_01_FULL_41_9]
MSQIAAVLFERKYQDMYGWENLVSLILIFIILLSLVKLVGVLNLSTGIFPFNCVPVSGKVFICIR